MKKITSLLPRIIQILIIIPLLGINLAMAYIMFAPDTWPKPFYLQYTAPTQTETEATAGESNAHAEEGSPLEAQPVQAAASETGEASSHTPIPLSPSAALELRPGQGLMYDTGTKIVNLVDPSGRRYLRAGIVLEFAPTDLLFYTMEGEEKALYLETFNEEISAIQPVINDVIITLLSTQTFDSVYTAEGKEALRKTLQDTVNSQVPEHKVIFVYFTEFVVQ